jgi:hypothetical protein
MTPRSNERTAMEDWEIRPGIGVGPLVLGVEMDDVIAEIGEPETAQTEVDPDGSTDDVWIYETSGLILTFSDDYDWRLGAITVEDPSISFNGHRWIGLSEDEFLALWRNEGLGDIALDDDFEESEMRAYASDDLSLCFWFVDGKLHSMTVMPFYDPSGEIPEWPEEG